MNPDLPATDSDTAEMPKSTWIILGIIAAISAGGINFIEWLKDSTLMFPDPGYWYNSFFVVAGKTEPAGLYVVLGFCVIVALVWARKSSFLPKLRPDVGKLITALAVIHFLISAAGTWLVTLNHPLACDEFMPDFQARIFLSGKFQGTIPEDLRFVARHLTPLLAVRTADDSRWDSGYLPVYAALRSPFLALHLQTLFNPLLGALSVLGTAGVVRLIWPGKPWLAPAGAAMIALSPQLLVNDMTVYAMPAHLALNTLWLWLFLQPTKKRFWLAPFVGFLALGLHSPFVHALFVAPFLIRLLAQKHWKAVVVFAIVYLAGCFCWWFWWHEFAPGNANAVGSSNPFLVWHTQRISLIQPLNILNLVSWNALPVVFLALIGLRFYKRLPMPVRDGFMGCVLTFCFYVLVLFDQSYGWGNRYCYGILGCLVLLAVAGLDEWTNRSRDQKPGEFVLIGLAITCAVTIPLRCWQVESFIRPFATAQKAFQKMDVDLVIFDSRMAWNTGDLLRNSPFLDNRPLILNQRNLTTENAELLRRKFPKNHFVTKEELVSYGLYTEKWQPPTRN